MKKRIISFFCALCTVLAMTACTSDQVNIYEPEDTAEITQNAEAVEPEYDEGDLFVSDDEDGTIVFDGTAAVSGSGLSSDGSVVTISEEGTYTVRGKSSDGQIIVSCSEKDDVTLILDNLTITSKKGPALWCIEADTLTVSLPEGSSSSLSDGSSRPDSNTPDAAIYSMGDLYFNGTGALTVNGNCNNAIQSKDGLTILQCSLAVTAADDGIIGKDSLEIGAGAVISINSEGDGLRTTNTEDDGRGNIYIGNCTLDIDSGADALQAAVSTTIDEGAVIDLKAKAKGIKAAASLVINDVSISADCADDAIHCNGDILISDGSLMLKSEDDGIHADSALTVSGGIVEIAESFEGLEANVIDVTGGKIFITSRDDGINVAGGNDSSGAGGMWGNDMFAEDRSCLLTVSGGTITVNASGDGVDSNGSIKMSGGEMFISGPTDRGNGFLDFSGDFEITGGTLLAVGTGGMAQTTNAGTQASVAASINGTVPAGSVLTLKTADETEILSFTAPKNYNFIVASSPLMSDGESVSFYIDGELLGTLEASVNIGSSAGMGGPGGPGGGHPGGGHGPGGR